jgi:hypothetical protein
VRILGHSERAASVFRNLHDDVGRGLAAHRPGPAGLPVAALIIECPGVSAVYVGLTLVTTALGTILPIVREMGWLGGSFGGRIPARSASSGRSS